MGYSTRSWDIPRGSWDIPRGSWDIPRGHGIFREGHGIFREGLGYSPAPIKSFVLIIKLLIEIWTSLGYKRMFNYYQKPGGKPIRILKPDKLHESVSGAIDCNKLITKN